MLFAWCEVYVTILKYKEMMEKWRLNHGSLPSDRYMPSKMLLEVVLKAKDEGHFPVIPIADVKTHSETVLEEATKSIKGESTRKVTFCPEEMIFKEE